ncbi:hypothetical protein AB0F42_02115 [Streptomyces buecherae]|uniref:hypothetical protein n=1 Tax=Streptomyces buecherae TaxID=2763006 RepID=UPI0033D8AEC1
MNDHSAKEHAVDPTTDVDPEQLAAAVARSSDTAPAPEATDSPDGVFEVRSGHAEAAAEPAARSSHRGPAVRRQPRASGS